MSIEVTSSRGATKIYSVSVTDSDELPELFEKAAQLMRDGTIDANNVTGILVYEACVYDSTEWTVDLFMSVITESGDVYEWWKGFRAREGRGLPEDLPFGVGAAWTEANRRRNEALVRRVTFEEWWEENTAPGMFTLDPEVKRWARSAWMRALESGEPSGSAATSGPDEEGHTLDSGDG